MSVDGHCSAVQIP